MVAAGDKIRASDIISKHGVRLRRLSTTQTVSTATLTSISWDTEDEDTDGYWSSGTTVTIPTGLGGIYAIAFRTAYTASMTGRCFIEIGPTTTVTGHPAQWRNPSRDTEDEYAIGLTVPLLAGDTFLCRVFHSSGANRSANANLSCYRIGTFS